MFRRTHWRLMDGRTWIARSRARCVSMWTAESEYNALQAGIIVGSLLAVIVPLAILGYCIHRRVRRRSKKGKENKLVKTLTGSRLSVNNDSGIAKNQEPKWKPVQSKSPTLSSGIGSAHSDAAHSSPPDSNKKPSPSSGSFDRQSPATDSTGPRSSPSYGSHSSGSPNRPRSKSGIKYDGSYYTGEPIQGTPAVEFGNVDADVIHKNTEV